MNNADLIVAFLKQAGVTHGFGIPSGNVLPLIEAMRLGGMEFVLTAHEGSASFAADVMGRMTGKPGFCIATLGPGATNLATGVGSAYLDRSPMIAITCNLNTRQLGRRIQMWIDHHALFSPITKASMAARKDNVAEVMKNALTLALTEPMGPVHIDLPEDVSLSPALGTVENNFEIRHVGHKASDQDIATAMSLIKNAKRPIAILGSSAMRMKDPSLLKTFVEHCNIPFGSSTMAKGMIDENHHLNIGCIERGKRQIQRKFIQSADLVIGLGFDTIEVEYEAWIGSTPVLSIDIEDPDVDDTVNVVGKITGDITDSLERLIGAPTIKNDWTQDDLDKHMVYFNEALRPESTNFTPHEAIDIVREVLPENGIITYDVGAHTHQIASQWKASSPKTCHVTNGWSSMGIGIPAAIAAKIARPDLPVVCLIGDGCFQMTAGELATARRQQLSIPVVVLNDRWLSLIQLKQEKRQYAQYGSEVEMSTYDEPPRHYFGVPAVGVRNKTELRSALEKALSSNGSTVIEAMVDGSHYLDTVFD
ncbi:MAG: acetolactate synthase [Rhodospirillaceae bacterium]|nr:acetolactate synthase [Rhodospirillaceae bacterium]